MKPPLRHRSVRPRARRGRFSPFAKFVLSLFVIEAVYFGGAKTNAPPRSIVGSMVSPTPATVSDEEIARGYRLAGVTTNAGVSYAMPGGVEPTLGIMELWNYGIMEKRNCEEVRT